MLQSLQFPFLLLTIGVLLLERPARRGLALVGLTAAGLAIAAFQVRAGSGPASTLVPRLIESHLAPSFLRINLGLLLLGLATIIVAALLARTVDRDRSLPTALGCVMVLGAGMVLVVYIAPAGSLAGWIGSAVAGIVILLAVMVTVFASRLLRVRPALLWLDAKLLEPRDQPLFPNVASTFEVVWLTGFMVAAIGVAVAPSLRATCLAIMIAATVAHVLLRREASGFVVPLMPLLSAFVIPVFHYYSAITGNPNPLVAGLADAPISEAAEIRLVPWVALATWGFSGLWPFNGATLTFASPLAIVIFLRLASQPLADGVAHWAPLLMPVALLGLWHLAFTATNPATRTRRLTSLLVAVALFGSFAGGAGLTGAAVLAGAAALFPWLRGIFALSGEAMRVLGRVLWALIAGAMLEVLAAGLAVQVTYTVAAAAGIAATLWSLHYGPFVSGNSLKRGNRDA